MTNIALLGVPTHAGAAQPGCQMGPEAYRTAGLAEALTALGHHVEDRGDIRPAPARDLAHSNAAVKNLGLTVAWTEAIQAAGRAETAFPVFLGGDHCLAAGSISAMAERAAAERRPLFVLWLDAHPDAGPRPDR